MRKLIVFVLAGTLVLLLCLLGMGRRKFMRLALVQAFIIVICATAWFFIETWIRLDSPPSAYAKLYPYTHTWDFSLIVFVFAWLPAVLIGSIILLCIEYIILKVYDKWYSLK